MALYFRPFPTIPYRIPGSNRRIAATDITRRFALTSFILNSKVAFDEYFIKDGERPDTVAKDYYLDSTVDWLVLLCNEILDPYYQWPMGYEQFHEYIRQKHGSVETALQTTHHYEYITQESQVIIENSTRLSLPEKTLVVDYETYAALPASKRKAVSVFEHENALNEKNRNIYLLDFNFLDLIKEQHPYVFEEGPFVR